MYYPVSHEKEMYTKYIRKLRPRGDGATVVLKITQYTIKRWLKDRDGIQTPKFKCCGLFTVFLFDIIY